MHNFLKRKQCELPLQSHCFSRACAITLFMEVIQSFISCPRISQADVAENLSLDNRTGCTMKRMQMVPFLLCLTVSFKESQHGTACAVHNGARQKDQSWRQRFSFLADSMKEGKKGHLSSPLKYNFSEQNDFGVQFNSCTNLVYGTTGGRKKTDFNLANQGECVGGNVIAALKILARF